MPFGTRSSNCRSSLGKSFYCATSKMRLTGRSRKYCQSRWELLCRAWPERGRRFASRCLTPSSVPLPRFVSPHRDALRGSTNWRCESEVRDKRRSRREKTIYGNCYRVSNSEHPCIRTALHNRSDFGHPERFGIAEDSASTPLLGRV